jgi:hypothetical protein
MTALRVLAWQDTRAKVTSDALTWDPATNIFSVGVFQNNYTADQRLHVSGGISRSGGNTNSLSEVVLDTYYSNQLLFPSTTDTLIQFSKAEVRGVKLDYTVETVAGAVRTGTVLLAYDNTSNTLGFSDQFVETSPVSLTLSATDSGPYFFIEYTTGVDACLMFFDVKTFHR